MPNTRLQDSQNSSSEREHTAEEAPVELDLKRVVLPTPGHSPDSIVGGAPTDEFPDCCAVGNVDEGFFCSGTLIAPNLVVTAGHCENVNRVFLAGSDVSKLSQGELIDVLRDHAIPGSDLRVLVLASESTVAPRHVAQEHEVRDGTATLVGFGNVDFDGTVGYGRKRKVEVPITSLHCAGSEDTWNYGCQRNNEMVAGHRGLNRDSCTGDSGGPLYILAPTGEFFLLGATSRGVSGAGKTCGDGGIYVRVDKFLSYIREVLGLHVDGPML